ncbi:HAD-IA family hydrolase [Comamonas testosteroni]|uniref:HAD family hydrolase n=1 Tax=Comamonas testosteroni TaxID=285 RepID=UPI00265DE308|nr:HAD-IA family hydrolase [Comamonas testosteroni]WKL17267.1 HAD-IA family hydrolase [Comamonas testosteroni]WQD44223.1 HAD-IA family hydrolase [Comamonas testosteroni]
MTTENHSARRPRRFDLIAFDWDGTVADSTAIISRSIQEAVRDVGGTVPSDEQAAYVIGMALMPALARAAPDVPPEKYPELANRYRFHFFKHQDDICVFDGILPLLAELRERGHWLTVATGKSRMGLNHALQDPQLKGLFDGSRTADETAGKPSPLMLHELMAEFGVEPERTLMIGDTTHDLQMAQNAGCACVGVSYGAHAPDGFSQFNPLFVADSAAQLRAWLLASA